MPDITMCLGQVGDKICPQKNKCYRHTATPSQFKQSYFLDLPMNDDETCGYFWKNSAYTSKKKQDHHNKDA
jgi:hypothetical protein